MFEPAYSFTIPSLHNDTPLDCRIYEPTHISDILAHFADNNRPLRGVVIAHPYAPLGGSYDDPVVLALAKCLLKQGYLVGTFNFRGASDSKGKTSWTGRAEREDLESVIGFMVYVLHRLQTSTSPHRPCLKGPQGSDSSRLTNDTLASGLGSSPSPKLLLAGYSYGSLILSRLQRVESMISRFEEAEHGTSAGEIILCARKLAQEMEHAANAQQTPTTPRGRQHEHLDQPKSPVSQRMRPSPVVMGGEETDPAARRRSRDSRRSVDIVRKSADLPRRFRDHVRKRSDGVMYVPPTDEPPMPVPISPLVTTLSRTNSPPAVEVSYLLVSPLLPPLAHALASPSTITALFRSPKGNLDRGSGFASLESRTLMVWGSADSFTTGRRLRAWAEELKEQSEIIEWEEIDQAGHFWREQGVMHNMLDKVARWVTQVEVKAGS